MDEETKTFVSLLCGKNVESLEDMTPVDIEALLNEYCALSKKYADLSATVQEYMSLVQDSRAHMLAVVARTELPGGLTSQVT